MREYKNNVYITREDGKNIVEVHDKGIDNDSSLGGSYSFFKSGNLQLYLFFRDKDKYSYSEEYDSLGNLIKKKGSPLVEYRVINQTKDSIFLAYFFFSLNKKYEDLSIATNINYEPSLVMFKSKFYSNMKVITFGVPLYGVKSDIYLYTKGIVRDTLLNQREYFTDTNYFKLNVR